MFSRLQRRADGAIEDSEGKLAVFMREHHGLYEDGDYKVFRYQPTFVAPVTVISWPAESDYAIIDPDAARWLLRNGKARGLTDDELSMYNDAVDSTNKALAEAEAEEAAAAKQKADEEAAAVAKQKADEKAAAAAADAKQKADEEAAAAAAAKKKA